MKRTSQRCFWLPTTLLLALLSLPLTGCGVPYTQFEVTVVDLDNSPVAEARVGAAHRIPGEEANELYEGTTDEQGIFELRANPPGSISLGISKEGYYKSSLKLMFPDFSQDSYSLQAVMKPVKNPIPMYARSGHRPRVPALDTPLGFDFFISDWVAPYGKGQETHIIVTAHKSSSGRFDNALRLEVTFPHDGDGIMAFEPLKVTDFPRRINQQPVLQEGSHLHSDYEAPADGYQPYLMMERVYWTAPDGEINGRNTFKDHEFYYIRLMTVLDQDGQVVRAHYGKIYPDFILNNWFNENPLIHFGIYYINPTPNDRNVEFKLGHSLIPNLKRDQMPQWP